MIPENILKHTKHLFKNNSIVYTLKENVQFDIEFARRFGGCSSGLGVALPMKGLHVTLSGGRIDLYGILWVAWNDFSISPLPPPTTTPPDQVDFIKRLLSDSCDAEMINRAIVNFPFYPLACHRTTIFFNNNSPLVVCFHWNRLFSLILS